MYDPVLGRFLSPDPVLQFPDNSHLATCFVEFATFSALSPCI